MSGPVNFQNPGQVHRAVPAPPARPDRTLLAIMLLAAFSLAGMLALLPGTEEKAEGLLAEGRYSDAISMLVDVEKERPLNNYEGYMLFRLYMLAREPDRAAALIGQQPPLHFDNIETLRELSDLYRQMGDVHGEITILRRIYDTTPTDADFSRLRVLYRLLGDTAGEASLLTQAIEGGRSDVPTLERLAYLRESTDGAQVAFWVAPSGSFWRFEAARSAQVLAMTNLPSFETPLTAALE